MERNKTIGVLKKVFGNEKYTLLALFIALAFYLLNAGISNFSNLYYYLKDSGFLATIQFFFILLSGFHRTMTMSSTVTLIILSVMTGVLLSLMAYKFRTFAEAERVGLLSGIGLFLGFLVPGCAACGIGLAAALGLGASFATLPFKGLELSVLAIVILGFAIVKTSDNLFKCDIKIKKR
jgi:hypothetical protein